MKIFAFINKFSRLNGGGRNFMILCLFLALAFFWPRPDVLAVTPDPDLVPKDSSNNCRYDGCIGFGDMSGQGFVAGNSVKLKGEIAYIYAGDDIPITLNNEWYAVWQIDVDNNDSMDFTFTPTNIFQVIHPGESTVIQSESSWLLTRGTHRVRYCVDPANLVAESNETNNCVEKIFTLSAYTLTATKSGTGGGAVHSLTANDVSNDGINCGDDCSELYDAGWAIRLYTLPNNDSFFAGWSGDSGCGDGRPGVIMDADKTCNAIFEISKGVIFVSATWRGSSWSGPLNYTITGPEIINGSVIDSGQSEFYNKPMGAYIITYLSGGPPAGGKPIIISPSSLSLVNNNQAISFRLNFDAPFDVSLTASPAEGPAPLTTNLSASIWAATIMPINYYFWWNCANSTTDKNAAIAACGNPADSLIGNTIQGISGEYPKIVPHVYSSPGAYQAKIIAEATNFNPAQSSAVITVGTPPLLTVTKAGVGLGGVTSQPAGIDCGATCSADFNKGDEVVLTAAPTAGYGFAGWSGACSGKGTCAVTMDAAKNITATFVSPPNPPSNLSAPNWSCAP